MTNGHVSSWSAGRVRKSLVARLRARPGLAGKQVEPAWPGDEEALESMWFGSMKSTDDVAGMRSDEKRYNDVYDLEAFIKASKPGKDYQEAEDAALAMTDELLTEIAARPRIDTGIDPDSNDVLMARIHTKEIEPAITKDAREAWVRVVIKVTARR